MSFIRGLIMCLGMFTVIPVPKNSWDERVMPMVIPALPIAGGIIGIIWYWFTTVLVTLNTPPLILSALMTLTPFWLTGLIHADGFMDTADAVLSRRSLGERKRILKDPNVGAFAVMGIIMVVLLQFCAAYTALAEGKPLWTLALIPVVSRCAAALGLLHLKPACETGYAASFRKGAAQSHRAFLWLLTAAAVLLPHITKGTGSLPLLLEALTGIIATAYLKRQFEGISGDLCGCVITLCETAALFSLAVI